MFCSKCGKKLLEGDVFCPGCGTRIEWSRYEESKPMEEVSFETVSEPAGESFDFNWNLDDFHREKNSDVKIEWGDLLGIEERKIAAASKVEAAESILVKDAEAETPAEEAAVPEIFPEEMNEEPEAVPVAEPETPVSQNKLTFDTFNRKNQEFQALLDKERQRVRKTAEEQAMVSAEIDQWAEESGIQIAPAVEEEAEEAVIPQFLKPAAEPETPEPAAEPEPEVPEEPAAQPEEKETLSFFERRRRKKEEKKAAQKASTAAAGEEKPAAEPLKLDEENIGGEWNEDVSAVEVVEEPQTPEPVPEKEETELGAMEALIASDSMAEPSYPEEVTQNFSRDELSDFLKSIEAQFGIEEPEEEAPAAVLEEEPVVELTGDEELNSFIEPELPAEEPVSEPELPAEELELPAEEPVSEPELPAEEPELLVEEPVSEPEPEVPEEPAAQPEKTEKLSFFERSRRKKEEKQAAQKVSAAVAPAPELPVEEPVSDPELPAEPAAEPEAVPEEPEVIVAEPEKVEQKPVEIDEDDDEFWDEDYRGSAFGTFIIVLLSLILAVLIGILVIRFQFPDSQAAHIIEPRITVIEQWIRNLIS